LSDFEKSEETAIEKAFHLHYYKNFEDSLTCGCDSTDSVRYHLRAKKKDLSIKVTRISILLVLAKASSQLRLKCEALAQTDQR
jgi:hypothetical protein